MIIHMSIPPLWRYRGWFFEYDRNKPLGPWPLNKDGEPRQTPPGRVFFDMFEEWQKLLPEEKEKTRAE
jgi:hypothetical protein